MGDFLTESYPVNQEGVGNRPVSMAVPSPGDGHVCAECVWGG